MTCAVFAPHPELVFDFIEKQKAKKNAAAGITEEHSPLTSVTGGKDSNSTNKG